VRQKVDRPPQTTDCFTMVQSKQITIVWCQAERCIELL